MQYVSSLDRIFHALADETRRSIIRVLVRGEPRDVSELGRVLRCRPACVRGHLRVMVRAGIIQRSIEAGARRFQVDQRALLEAGGWISRQEGVWVRMLDQLDQRLAQVASDQRQADRDRGPVRQRSAAAGSSPGESRDD